LDKKGTHAVDFRRKTTLQESRRNLAGMGFNVKTAVLSGFYNETELYKRLMAALIKSQASSAGDTPVSECKEMKECWQMKEISRYTTSKRFLLQISVKRL